MFLHLDARGVHAKHRVTKLIPNVALAIPFHLSVLPA